MIDAKMVMATSGIKDVASAEKMAKELNEYSLKNNVDEKQIIDILKQYQSKNTRELENQQAKLTGKADTLKRQFKDKLL